MRLTRPFSITLLAAAYILSPVGNLLLATLVSGHDLGSIVEHSLQGTALFGATLVALGPVAGAGIYSGRRWGLLAFVVHALAVLAYNAAMLSGGGHPRAAPLLVIDIAVFAAVAILLRKDMHAPFLDQQPRGWRLKKRIAAALPIKVTCGDVSVSGKTINLSGTGVLAQVASQGLVVGVTGVCIITPASGAPLQRPVRVIRIDKDSVALAFEDRADLSTDRRTAEILTQLG